MPWGPKALLPTYCSDSALGTTWGPPCLLSRGAPDAGKFGVVGKVVSTVTANLAGPAPGIAGVYDAVQFVALELCTRTRGFEMSDLGDDDSYEGLRHLERDMKVRVDLLRQALEVAHRDPRIDTRPTTLKLFMAPECFFRGPSGAHAVNEILGRTSDAGLPAWLGGLLAEDRWEHWVAVFGTMAGCCPAVDEFGMSSFEIYNVCIVQKGGAGGPSSRATIVKQCRSKIDIFSDPLGCLQDSGVRHLVAGEGLGRHLAEQCLYRECGDTDDNGIFEIAGIRFGFEACLDHAQERLKSCSGMQGVQIQLVASGGMGLCFGSIAAVANGLVFHVDGLMALDREDFGSSSSAWVVPMAPSERVAMRLTAQHSDGMDLAQAMLRELHVLGEAMPFSPLWRQRLQGLFDTSSQEPKLRIYAAAALPKQC